MDKPSRTQLQRTLSAIRTPPLLWDGIDIVMWNDTAVTRQVGNQYPIVQGRFGGGVSTAELVAAVSNAAIC